MAFSTSTGIKIQGIVNVVPENTEDNSELSIISNSERQALIKHTGIRFRKVSPNSYNEVKVYFNHAVQLLLEKLDWDKSTIDILICVTQTSVIAIPSVACQMHGDLEFDSKTMCYDINSGCSGFVYGLHTVSQLLNGLANTGARAILCCGDLSTTLVEPTDRSVRPIFSDGVSAIGLEKCDDAQISGYFNLETMGSGQHAIRSAQSENSKSFMRLNGIDVFNYSVAHVPNNIDQLLHFSSKSISELDGYFFHQANKLINDSIAKKLGLETTKVKSTLYEYGNTASASIPITLGQHWSSMQRQHNWILLSGFGVGFSIASAIIKFEPIFCDPPIELTGYEEA